MPWRQNCNYCKCNYQVCKSGYQRLLVMVLLTHRNNFNKYFLWLFVMPYCHIICTTVLYYSFLLICCMHLPPAFLTNLPHGTYGNVILWAVTFILMLIFSIFEANDAGWPTFNKGNASLKPPDWKESVGDIPSKTASPAGTPSDKVWLPVSVLLSLLKEYSSF